MTATEGPTPIPDKEETEQWLARLSGSESSSVREAPDEEAGLRRAIGRHHERLDSVALAASPQALDDDLAWQRMQFRLRREGLLGKRRAQWTTWAGAAAAALVLGIGLVQALRPGPTAPGVAVTYAAPPTLRSVDPGIEESFPDPLTTAQLIGTRLRSLDLEIALYWHAEIATLDFKVRPETLDEAITAIKSSHPQVAVHPGWNRIIFTRPSKKRGD